MRESELTLYQPQDPERKTFIKSVRSHMCMTVLDAYPKTKNSLELIGVTFKGWEQSFPQLKNYSTVDAARVLFTLYEGERYLSSHPKVSAIIQRHKISHDEFLKLCAGNALMHTIEVLIADSVNKVPKVTDTQVVTAEDGTPVRVSEDIQDFLKQQKRTLNSVGEFDGVPFFTDDVRTYQVAKTVGIVTQALTEAEDPLLSSVLFLAEMPSGTGFFDDLTRGSVLGIGSKPHITNSISLSQIIDAHIHEKRHANQPILLPGLLKELDAIYHQQEFHTESLSKLWHRKLPQAIERKLSFGLGTSLVLLDAKASLAHVTSRLTHRSLGMRLTADHNILRLRFMNDFDETAIGYHLKEVFSEDEQAF